MKEITHHIENLLLYHDCVIVPGLGGFVAQDCGACYVEEEGLFLPPYRSVSFNPRLTVNDGLIASRVMQLDGCSYEKALVLIDNEVREIRNTIEARGEFSFPGVGVLKQSKGRYYDFKPLPCGIAAPSLYGLDCFYKEDICGATAPVVSKEVNKHSRESFTFSIPMNVIRYAAVAAVMAVFYFISIAPLNSAIHQGISEAGMMRSLWSLFVNEDSSSALSEEAEVIAIDNAEKVVSDEASKLVESTTAAETEIIDAADINLVAEASSEITEATTTIGEKVTKQEAATPADAKVSASACMSGTYTIVVASSVTEANANHMVSDWKKQGLKDAKVYVRGKMVRVVYGAYKDESAAQAALRNYRSASPEFAEAWIYQIP